MRVAIVINTAWNIFNFRMGLIRAFREKGMEVVAIAPSDGFEKDLIEEGCSFFEVPMEKTGANPLKELKLIHRLYKAYKAAGPDIILHYTIKPNTYGSLAAKWLRIPVINNVSGLGTVFLNKGLVSRIARWVYRYTFRYPGKVFFQNDHDRDLFLQKGLVSGEVAEVIPGSGIDLEKFYPSANGTMNEKFTFLMISRILVDKGVEEYIEAIRILRKEGYEARFQLLGPLDPEHKRGIPGNRMDRWKEEGLVEYLGTTNNVRDFIRNIHCVVLPSYREGAPKTLLEAAAMGKPLVATDVPGCNSVVEHDFNGFLCKPRDAADLADKMKRMIGLNPVDRERLGSNSRKLVETKFDEKIVIDRYLDTINKLVHKA